MLKKAMERKKEKLGWWIIILADKPMYIYYFGVFDSYWEAKFLKEEYAEDLKKEGSEIIGIQIKQCQPKELTIPATPHFNIY